MTMKKFIGTLSAAIAATALTASAGVDVDIVSAYVFRGGTEADDPSVQPGFETEIFDGFATVGTWASFNLDSNEWDEVDFYVEIPLPTGDLPFGATLVYTEYLVPGGSASLDEEGAPVFSSGFDPLREFGLVFDYEVEGVELELGIYHTVDGVSDLYVEIGAGYGLDLMENVGLDLGAVLGYLDPDEGDSGFSHLTLSATVGIEIPESPVAFSLGLSYVVELDDDVLEVDEDLYFTLGFSM